jgi:shikimate dehydrogenase
MNSIITGKTIVCGIIADPIPHTLSPQMHNAAFKALGLDYVYVPFKVKSLELKKAIEGMRGMNIRGLNVTLPHKVSVMQFLDRFDPMAEAIGAVNTIVNDGGILTGYNTDATGFLQTLRVNGIDPKGKRIMLVGAGGAARAIATALSEQGAKIVILNRKKGLAWATDIAFRLAQSYHADIRALELTPENLKNEIQNSEMLVNATNVGMSPDKDSTPIPTELLVPGLTVFDIVYNPTPTRLLQEAKAAGAPTIEGIEMLVQQGAVSFEKWTGVPAPLDIMRQTVLSQIQKNEN